MSPSTASKSLLSLPPRATKPWALAAPWSAVPRTAEPLVLTNTSEWVDTKIILDTADPNYIQTFGKGEGVTGGEMTTSDGGKTWVISDVNIPSFTF
ncbi:hypothetical protein LB505_010449 [Fusarium chuoi]|nr:hypothetical protein LB505_010449 [Fusarium chuoi]